jgi:pimeloyl-ACP methyl ester carboxylesterase
MEANTLIVDGARIRAYRSGTSGPFVLFLHGTGGSGKAWYHQLRRLAPDYRAIALDLPGYGHSELTEGVTSVDDYAPFVIRCLDALGVDRAVVVGNSMGGRVCLQLALDHPERVQGLVLVDSSGIRVPGVPMLSPADVGAEEFARALFFRPAMSSVPAGRPAWLDTMERLTQRPLRGDLGDRLGEIAVPTLILWGQHDRVIPPAYAEALHRGIRGSQLVWIARAGHVPMLERPGEVNEALAGFLEVMRRAA